MAGWVLGLQAAPIFFAGIPVGPLAPRTRDVQVSIHQLRGTVHIALADFRRPALILHARTRLLLFFG